MFDDKSIMKPETTLPENFEGTFYFTNWTDEEFVGTWGKKEYHFPARLTSPLNMPEHTVYEVQNIRKKFAKDLAEQEFFRSKGYKVLVDQEGTPGNRTMTGIHQAAAYSMNDLTPFIQRCLEPLPVSKATVTVQKGIRIEEKISLDKEGQITSAAIGSDKDLEKLAKGEISSLDKKVFG